MQSQAELDANRIRARWLDEQIRTETDGIALTLDATARLIGLSEKEKQRADPMAVAGSIMMGIPPRRAADQCIASKLKSPNCSI